ncbi:MAG: YigZ family protein [Synergistaceae bacterium]|nr:YigZ family protein [Synergistaceae bacterium]
MADGKLSVFRAPRRDCDAEFTEKRSRFIGSIRTVLDAEEAAEIIKKFPESFPKANHHCWGYRIGAGTALEHCSDAGEPAGTAGRPILGVIKRHELTNTLIVVTRYFGGIKLGVRGLIDAYKAAAESAVAEAGAVEMEFHNALLLRCGYDYSKTLDRTLRKWGFSENRLKVEYGADVSVRLEVPLSMKQEIEEPLEEMRRRSFLTELQWDDAPLVRERWS